MKVEFIRFSEGQKRFPNHYLFDQEPWQWTDYIVIDYEDGTEPQIEAARREPEDVAFFRDLKWIKAALLRAYNTGKQEEK